MLNDHTYFDVEAVSVSETVQSMFEVLAYLPVFP